METKGMMIALAALLLGAAAFAQGTAAVPAAPAGPFHP